MKFNRVTLLENSCYFICFLTTTAMTSGAKPP